MNDQDDQNELIQNELIKKTNQREQEQRDQVTLLSRKEIREAVLARYPGPIRRHRL
jgi:hypothetical protein